MKTPFHSLAPLSVLAGALLLSSCGGGGSSGPSTTSGGTTAGSTSGGTTAGSTSGGTTAGSTSGGTTAGSTSGGTTAGSTSGGTTAGSTSGGTTAGSTTAGTTAGGTTNGGTTAGGPGALSGQIGFVSTRDGSSDIYAMDAQGNNQRALASLNSDSEERSPSISRDGNIIVWSSNRPNKTTPNFEIYIQRPNGLGGQTIEAYTNDAGSFPPDDTEPVISPDGTKIAWTTTRGGDKNIAVMQINGDNQVVLTLANTGEDSQPAWTSDSQNIAFYSERGNTRGVYIMSASGASQRELLTSDAASGVRYLQPAYAPNGGRFAVTVESAGGSNISLRNADGSPVTDDFNAGSGFTFRTQPSFSNDGNRLIYVGSNSSMGDGQIQTANLNGSGERSLTSAGQNFDARFSN